MGFEPATAWTHQEPQVAADPGVLVVREVPQPWV
jgi:hypothetical protein